MCSDVNVESITLLHSVEGWLLFQGLRLRVQSEDMQLVPKVLLSGLGCLRRHNILVRPVSSSHLATPPPRPHRRPRPSQLRAGMGL